MIARRPIVCRSVACLVILAALMFAGCDQRAPVGAKPAGGHAGSSPADSSHEDWSSHTQGLPFVFGYEAGRQESQAQQKPVMYFVTTTWCGWCRKLAGEAFQDERIKQLLTDEFVCVIVDGDTEKAAAKQLGARGFPHLVFENAAGKKVNECRGYVPKDRFLKIVEEALSKASQAS